MNIDKRYECMRDIYQDMIDQIQKGKGIKQHGSEVCFKEQHTWQYMKLTGPGGPLFQMFKKATEAIERMDGEKQYHELIGALNYGVFAAMLMRDALPPLKVITSIEDNGTQTVEYMSRDRYREYRKGVDDAATEA